MHRILYPLICLKLAAYFVNCDVSWMCSEWPKTIKCSDTQHIIISDVQFESIPDGKVCETDEGLPSSSPILYRDVPRCNDDDVLFAANKLCSGQSECVLSLIRLLGDSCYWPENKKLKIQYTCHPMFVCNSAFTSLKANCYTKNLHKRPAAWARDVKWHVDAVFLLPWVKHGGTRTLYEYPLLERFEAGWPFLKYHLPDAAASTSMALCNGMMFYVKHQTRHLIKYSLIRRQKIKERILPNALYNGEASYIVTDGGRNDIDFAIDESGLWVIYSTLEDGGNVVVSQIHMADLSVKQSWRTDVRKSLLINSFIVCGEIYLINKQREIFYKFDTASNTSLELPTSDSLTLPWHDATSVNYNPRDKMLYVWSLQQALMFTLSSADPSTQETTVENFEHHTVTTSIKVQRQNSTSITTFTSTFSTMSYDLHSNVTCPEVTRNAIKFPSVRANTQVMVSCPNHPTNLVHWECLSINDDLAHWSTSGPDFSNCLKWTKAIKLDVENANVQRASTKLLESVKTARILDGDDKFTSVDIEATTAIMKNLSQFVDKNDSKKSTAADYLHIYKNLVDTSNEIMNANLSASWHSMDELDKSNAFTNIMDSLESSAFHFVQKMIVENKRSKFTLHKESVAMSVQVVDTLLANSEAIILTLGNSSCETDDVVELSAEDVKANGRNGSTKVVFGVYKNFGELLNNADTNETSLPRINSHIVSVSLSAAHEEITLLNPLILTLIHKQKSDKTHSCVFWKPGNSTSVGSWSTSGCRVVISNTTQTRCECDHLTSFAVLMNHQDFRVSRTHAVALDYITWIGLTTSLICLALSIATFTFFKSLHCLRTTIHTNLCICLFISQLTFLTAIDLYEMDLVCSIVAGVLHYTFLATFTWMALEGFQLYVMLVEVFERFTSVAWYYVIGYGLPAVFVGISASINHEGYGTDTACWLSTELGGSAEGLMPFIWAFIGPASFVAIANIFFLVLTAVTIYIHARKYIYFSKIRAAKSSLCGTCALLCLLGSTWIFGIIWWWKHLMIIHYLFCFFNAFQGVYIFVFHCILHNKVRYEYRNFLSQCFGEKYFDNTTTSSLSIKYNGSRRRSSHTNYPQKWRRDSSSKISNKPFIYEKHVQAKHPSSKRRKSAPNIGPMKRDHGSMQAIVTRKNSITYLHPKLMFSSPATSHVEGGAFFAQRHYSVADRRSIGDIQHTNTDNSTKKIVTRHSMKATVNNCSKLVHKTAHNPSCSDASSSQEFKSLELEEAVTFNPKSTKS